MKNILKPSVLHGGYVVFALSMAYFGCPALADSDNIGALDAKVSLTTKSTFSQGQPIILHYSVKDTSNRKLGLIWGETEGCTLTLTDRSGVIVSANQPLPPPARGFQVVHDPILRPGGRTGGEYETSFVVPQRTISLHPGSYILTARVRLPYTIADSKEENPLEIERHIKASGNILSREFRFLLLITAPNNRALKATAASLLKTISAAPFGPEYEADAEALFSMPEGQAAASWQKLSSHPGSAMNIAFIADKLGDIGSVKASDLLLTMLDDPHLSSDNSMFVSRRLAAMYNSGSTVLRLHLKNTMMQRGLDLPNKIAISQPTD